MMDQHSAAISKMDLIGQFDQDTSASASAAATSCVAENENENAHALEHGGSSDALPAAAAANEAQRSPDEPTRDANASQQQEDDAGESSGDDSDDILHDVTPNRSSHAPNDDTIDDESLDRLMGLHDDDEAASPSSPTSRARRAQHTFDIEMSGGNGNEYGEEYDDDGNEHGHPRTISCCLSRMCCPCLSPCYQIGATTVLCPALYERTGKWGVVGPHWPGLVVTFALLWGAGYYYTSHAFATVGPISGMICGGFTTLCTILLVRVAFGDPGVITIQGQQRSSLATNGGDGSNGTSGGKYAGLPTDGRDLSDWRYCDLCRVYQPPTAAHCPDCQVCIDGYDHHCPWMGTCIGRRNMKAFVSFNLSWMAYLFYAVGWVTFGASMMEGTEGWPAKVAAAALSNGTDHDGAGNASNTAVDNSTGHNFFLL